MIGRERKKCLSEFEIDKAQKHEVDGETLEMVDTVEKIKPLLPKLKQQLLFLKEREKLFKVGEENSASNIDRTSITSTNSNLSSSSSSIESAVDFSTNDDTNDSTLEKTSIKQETNGFFPEEYIIPTLPNSLLQDIEAGALNKFGPHHTNRQVLVDIIVHDIINNYNLFYPTRKQFDDIGTAIVRQLKLPLTKDNIGIWKDAIQIKLKRKRVEHRDHADVQHYQSKYSRYGSGRPVKKMIGEVAKRDRQKQILLINYDNESLTDIQLKATKLRDDPAIDIDTRLQLWKDTIHVRRKHIRDRSTAEILEDFPGYTDSTMIFEEVKMTMGVDLRSVVRQQVPILLEKLIITPVFITESPPIQLIRLLCRQFEETIHHIYCNSTPSTPYPTLVVIDDVIYIYVDFVSVVSTTSPDDALALLIAMYTIFELNFHKHGRTIRLLYGTAFGDKRFLSNTIRKFIQEKHIDIYMEQNRKSSSTSKLINNKTPTINITSQSSSQDKLDSSSLSSIQDVNCLNDFNSTNNTTCISNESNKNVEETSSTYVEVEKQTMSRRKRPKKLSGKLIIDEKQSISDDDNSNDHNQNDITPSTDENSRPVRRQSRKRKCRY